MTIQDSSVERSEGLSPQLRLVVLTGLTLVVAAIAVGLWLAPIDWEAAPGEIATGVICRS